MNIRRQRRRATAAALVVALVGILAGVFASAVLLLWGLVAAVYTFYFFSRSRMLLVWPRHGHTLDHSRMRLDRALGDATAGLATPLSVLDETFPPPGSGGVQWILAALPAIVVATGLLAYVTDADSLYALLGPGEPASAVMQSVIIAVQCVLTLLVGLYLLRALIRRQGAVVGAAPEEAEVHAGRLVDRVRSGRAPFFGGVAVQCSDRSWPGVLRRAIADADAVLFNVTELDARLLADVEVAYRRVGAERVILACAVDDDAQAQGASRLPTDRQRAVEAAAGAPVTGKSPILVFPLTEPAGPGVVVGYQHLRDQLRERIAQALEAA
jgi:hypothetical protein